MDTSRIKRTSRWTESNWATFAPSDFSPYRPHSNIPEYLNTFEQSATIVSPTLIVTRANATLHAEITRLNFILQMKFYEQLIIEMQPKTNCIDEWPFIKKRFRSFDIFTNQSIYLFSITRTKELIERRKETNVLPGSQLSATECFAMQVDAWNYTVYAGDSGDVSRSSRKQYSRTPWRAYHPKPVLVRRPRPAVPAKGEGWKWLLRGRNPWCHHLFAALNTRWFIHEGSLTAITLIRLINGRCRRGVAPQEHLQRYSNGQYISGAYGAKTLLFFLGESLFSTFCSYVRQTDGITFALLPPPFFLIFRKFVHLKPYAFVSILRF